jgi:hypothetical protein
MRILTRSALAVFVVLMIAGGLAVVLGVGLALVLMPRGGNDAA